MTKALKLNLADLPERIGRLLSTESKESLLAGLIERDEQMRLMLLAALAGEHALLIGPPGTAKSLLARRLRLAFRDATYFERLLTQFSVPEDLFGPYMLSMLDDDKFVRKTTGYLPKADIAFLDEIFKSNPSILNSLLTILNERVFHNEGEKPGIDLKCLIGASNEVPEPGELNALYDRFLIRCEVGYVTDFRRLLSSGSNEEPKIPVDLQFTNAELEAIRGAAETVAVPESVDLLLELLRTRARELQLDVSDRRWLKVRKFLQTSAITNGRQTVSSLDLLLVPHCIWSPRQTPLPQVDPKAKEMAAPPPLPAAVRDELCTWLQERLWEATLAKPGLLGEQLTAWESKLQMLARQTAADRDAGLITSGVQDTFSLYERISHWLKILDSEMVSLDVVNFFSASKSGTSRGRSLPLEPLLKANQWLPSPVAQTSLSNLVESQRLTADLKTRAEAVLKIFRQLQQDATSEIHPLISAWSDRTAKAGRTKPDPMNFPGTARAARFCQEQWANYIGQSNWLVIDSFEESGQNSWTIEFALIPPGHFAKGNELSMRENITHPFLLGKYQITEEQWLSLTGHRVFEWDPWYAISKYEHDKMSGSRLPVVNVSWNDVVRFLNALSDLAGFNHAYTKDGASWKFDPKANGYRMPTESEWEYACRAGTTSCYWCGETEAMLPNIAWYSKNSNNRTHVVDEKNQPNPFDLVGMHGNVWEWCSNVDGGESVRVLRGGAWRSNSGELTSAYCCRNSTETPSDQFGFRVARTIFLDP